MRERDVRNAIRTALVATDAFSDVWVTGLPENYGRGADQLTAAAIEPANTRRGQGWDAGIPAVGGTLEYTATCLVTLLARAQDPQLRDELCEQLLDYLGNAVDGQGLGGLTVPQLTFVSAWSWHKAESQERRISATVSFSYLVSPWATFDVSQ